jgi:hypothetical protein
MSSATEMTRGQPSLFNPERPQALVARWAKHVSKGKLRIQVTYSPDGIRVLGSARLDDTVVMSSPRRQTEALTDSDAAGPEKKLSGKKLAVYAGNAAQGSDDSYYQEKWGKWLPLSMIAFPQRDNTDKFTDGQRLDYNVDRWERRFDAPCIPGLFGDGSEDKISVALRALPFRVKRAFLMSNKEFDKKYPNGFNNGFIAEADGLGARFVPSEEEINQSLADCNAAVTADGRVGVYFSE